MRESDTPTHNAIDAVWRIEAARLIGGLVRFVRDVDRAEDLAHEALLTALQHWPESGIPENPGAWLMTAAKNRAVDEARRRVMDEKHVEIEYASVQSTTIDEEALDDNVNDDVLRLVLIACHPVLSKDARVALTLRLIAGLSTVAIARAFLTPEATMAQRLVRAKRSLAEAKVPFETGLDLQPGHSTSVRICERIRVAIGSGALPLNARVPSSRTMAKDLGVARNTVDEALSRLVADGYIVRRRGAGSFVAPRLPERDTPPVRPKRVAVSKTVAERRISKRATALQSYPGHYRQITAVPFTPSLPPIDLFPRKVWNRLLNREMARAGNDYWEYGASNGLAALREAITAHTSAMRATRCSPDQVIVVTSTQQAVELASKVIADPGDCAWAESPGYQPVQHCLRAAGLNVVHVPVDEQGLSVAAGQRLAPKARLAYVTPAHQYPLGYEMSLERRKQLLEWAQQRDAYVVEDDYDGDYRYEGRPIASLQGMDGNGRVIYIGSFNKILFPALRIAYAIVPVPLVGAFVDAKHVADGHTTLLNQGVLAAFIHEGHLARHLRKTRAIYDERRLAFLEEAKVLADVIEFGPARAGMHVTGIFKQSQRRRIDDRAVAVECARAGIEVHPLSKYGVTDRAGLVFGFAGAARAVSRSGLEILRRALRKD